MGHQLELPSFETSRSDSGLNSAFSFATDRPRTESAAVERLLKIHEYERQRMGQELHDSAGQLLVSLQLSIAHLKLVEKDHGNDDLIEEIQETVARIDREIRSLAFLHYPVELGDRGLAAAIESLARGFGRRTGIATIFRSVGNPQVQDAPIATALLRVAQEALVNIHRHAHASLAMIMLRKRKGAIMLVVSDDGVGIPADILEKRPGVGVQGMRHRVEAFGGHLEITNLKHGVRVSVEIPIAT